MRDPYEAVSALEPAEWQERALCVREDPEAWFAPDGMNGAVRKAHIRAAQAKCAQCPVSDACFEAAMEIKPTDGVWAGVEFNYRESRRKLRRQRDRLLWDALRGEFDEVTP